MKARRVTFPFHFLQFRLLKKVKLLFTSSPPLATKVTFFDGVGVVTTGVLSSFTFAFMLKVLTYSWLLFCVCVSMYLFFPFFLSSFGSYFLLCVLFRCLFSILVVQSILSIAVVEFYFTFILLAWMRDSQWVSEWLCVFVAFFFSLSVVVFYRRAVEMMKIGIPITRI